MSPQTSRTATRNQKRWAAVQRRDARWDGEFYYSVKSTGVYCRPSCPARTPLRKNVAFHDSCEAAENAGFRPCQRCQPHGPTLAAQHAAKIADACRLLETAEPTPDLAALARAAALSKFHFHRVFTQITGLTPKAYARAFQARRLRQILPQSSTVTEAIYAAGFNSSARFYADSEKILGMTPRKFRRGGRGETIRFALGQCSLGAFLVAASKNGVCAISLGEVPDQLLEELQDLFPHAHLIGGDPTFESVVAKVVGFVESPGLGLDLPLDIRGTAFQQRVWQALRKIPAGATVSYAELAARIGSPRSVRAVATACAANTLAVAIPCHRVLRLNGDLSGYRWGIARKRTLLEREKHRTPTIR